MGTLLNTATWKSFLATIAGVIALVNPGNHLSNSLQIVTVAVTGVIYAVEHLASAVIEAVDGTTPTNSKLASVIASQAAHLAATKKP